MTYLSVQRGLETILESASQQQLEDLNTLILRALKRRYRSKHTTKYGNLNRNFTEEELARFYAAIHDEKYKLLYRCQDLMGLRIGEVIKINVRDISHDTRELTLMTEKSKKLDRTLIPDQLYNDLVKFIRNNEKKIMEAQGYVFFNARPRGVAPGHVQSNEPRKIFRKAAEKAGISQIYGYSHESTGRKPRPLYRLTTHSHRHYAATKFYRRCKDVKLTNMFLRHSRENFKDTMRYIGGDRDDMYKAIQEAFSTQEAQTVYSR